MTLKDNSKLETSPATLGRRIVWQPHPGFQQASLALDSFEGLIGGAAGPGKTDVLLYGGLRDIANPNTRVLFLRRTFPELREVIDRSLKTFPLLGGKWRESEKRWVFPSGATYEFGYCENYRDVLQYQGQEYTSVRFDEIGQIPDERVWMYLQTRIRTTDPRLRTEIRGSANPGGPGHGWLRRRFILPTNYGRDIYTDPETGLTRGFVPGRVKDNPSLPAIYIKQLMGQPERVRRALLDGDWDAGQGLALEELHAPLHIVRPFAIPAHWPVYAGFDWGYRHPWWLVCIAGGPDGDLYVFDALTGRRQLPHEIARTIRERLPTVRFSQIAAGHDVYHDHKARGENTPTVADALMGEGLITTPANISRIQGLNEMRRLLAWRGIARDASGNPTGGNDIPRLRFFDTRPVRRLWDQLMTIVSDPDRPEDALKVDADPDTGEGGDDGYDALRYAIASRPAGGIGAPLPEMDSTTDPVILAAEYERLHRRRGVVRKPETIAMGENAWQVL